MKKKSPNMKDFLRKWRDEMIEPLFERYDIARTGDEILDLQKLVLDIELENIELWRRLKQKNPIKAPRRTPHKTAASIPQTRTSP